MSFKQKIRLLLPIMLMGLLSFSAYGQNGKKLYQQNCARCHWIGQGKLVGPDLANISDKKSEEWLVEFIQSSQSVIKSGDEYADSLYKAFNETVMPDQDLSEQEVIAVLNYIEEQSPAPMAKKEKGGKDTTQKAASQGPPTIKPVSEATAEDFKEGKKLFAGITRLKNGGAACISCHHVKTNGMIGGGTYAKELTTVFKRLGEAGVQAMIQNPGFPEMQAAYQNKPLTNAEVFKLKAFLKQANAQRIYQHPHNYNARFLWTGISGMVIMLGVAATLWFRRKRKSVNEDIYNRQVKSS